MFFSVFRRKTEISPVYQFIRCRFNNPNTTGVQFYTTFDATGDKSWFAPAATRSAATARVNVYALFARFLSRRFRLSDKRRDSWSIVRMRRYRFDPCRQFVERVKLAPLTPN